MFELYSYDELYDLCRLQSRIIVDLRKKNAQLNEQINKFAETSMKQAMASDQMKLELIMSGCLNKPKV